MSLISHIVFNLIENAEYLKNIAGNSIIENQIVDFNSFKNNQIFKVSILLYLNNKWSTILKTFSKPTKLNKVHKKIYRIFYLDFFIAVTTIRYKFKKKMLMQIIKKLVH